MRTSSSSTLRAVQGLVLGLLIPFAGAQNDVSIPADTVVTLQTPGGKTLEILGSLASFGSTAAESPLFAHLATDSLHFGCTSDSFPVVTGGGHAYIVARGNCSFATKAQNAQAAGASAVIIYDSIPGMYFSGGNTSSFFDLSMPSCDVDCSAGSALIPLPRMDPIDQAYAGFAGKCNSAGTCASNLCGFPSSVPTTAVGREVCCVVSDLMVMGTTSDIAQGITIPSVFVTLSDGLRIVSAIQGHLAPAPERDVSADTIVSVSERPVPSFQGASALIWLLGTATVILASWLSGRVDKAPSSVGSPSSPPTGAAAIPPVTLTVCQGVSLLAFACGVLLGLYFLVKFGVNVALIVIAVFFFRVLECRHTADYLPRNPQSRWQIGHHDSIPHNPPGRY
jgi:hypothetical protein